MTKIKVLSAVAILSTVFATPVLAQSAVGQESQFVTNYRGQLDQTFRNAYDQSGAPLYARHLTNEEQRNLEDFGFSGRDPSRVGGEDPALHPAD